MKKDDILEYVVQGLIVLTVFAVGMWSYHLIAASDLPECLKFILLSASR